MLLATVTIFNPDNIKKTIKNCDYHPPRAIGPGGVLPKYNLSTAPRATTGSANKLNRLGTAI